MIFIILGPGGSGKTTLQTALLGYGFIPIVGCTTRKIRAKEEPGKDYYFITPEEYYCDDSLILKRQAGEKLYGIRMSEIEKKGEKKVMISSVSGILELEKRGHDLKVCFLNISCHELIFRMQKRGDTEDEISERLKIDEGKFDVGKINSPILILKHGTVDEITKQCLIFVGP